MTLLIQRIALVNPVDFKIGRNVEQPVMCEIHFIEKIEGWPNIGAIFEWTTAAVNYDWGILWVLAKFVP